MAFTVEETKVFLIFMLALIVFLVICNKLSERA